MKISMVTEKGICKDRNEDVFYKRETESGFCFVGIADGQSMKERCMEGAKAALVTVADCLQKYSVSTDVSNYHELIRLEIGNNIQKAFSILGEIFETEEEQFSSTLMCIAYNKKSNFLVTVHLGDGLIVSCKDNSVLQTISYPENGITRRHTWLTTNPAMLEHIRIKTCSLSEHKGILLITDGAYKAYGIIKEQCVFQSVNEVLSNANMENCLKNTYPEDDATMVYIEM